MPQGIDSNRPLPTYSFFESREEDHATRQPTRRKEPRATAMLTPEELTVLESLCSRARVAGTQEADELAPGDVVQIRPGFDPHWQTSLMLVGRVLDGKISGTILEPHRGGYREAWYTYRRPELFRIGRLPFPEPPASVRAMCYCPPCPLCHSIGRKPPQRETTEPKGKK